MHEQVPWHHDTPWRHFGASVPFKPHAPAIVPLASDASDASDEPALPVTTLDGTPPARLARDRRPCALKRIRRALGFAGMQWHVGAFAQKDSWRMLAAG